MLTSRSTQTQVVLYTSAAHGLVHAVEFTYPALLLTVERDLGISHLAAGILAQAFAVTFGLGALPSGFLVDRLGSRRVLVLAFLGGTLGCIFIAASPNEYLLGILLAVTGLCVGLYHPAGLSLIARWAQQRALAAGYHGVAGNVGIALAPVTAVTIATLVDWRAAFAFMAALCAAVAVLVGFARLGAGMGEVDVPAATEPLPAAPSRVGHARYMLYLVYGLFLLNGFIYRGSLTFLPTHIEESVRLSLFGLDEAWLAGSITTVALFGGAAGQLFGGTLSLRVRLERLAPLLSIALAPLLLVIGFASGALLVLAAAAFVFASFSTQPINTALMADYSQEGMLGRTYGLGFFLSFGLGSSAATVAGAIAEAWGVAAVYRALSLLAIAVFALSALVWRGWRREQSRAVGAGSQER